MQKINTVKKTHIFVFLKKHNFYVKNLVSLEKKYKFKCLTTNLTSFAKLTQLKLTSLVKDTNNYRVLLVKQLAFHQDIFSDITPYMIMKNGNNYIYVKKYKMHVELVVTLQL